MVHHSTTFVPRAARKPIIVKLISYALHNISPIMIGMRDSWTYKPFLSRSTSHEISTVNNGPELFTVSVNDTATYCRDRRLRNTTRNLQQENTV